MSKASKSWAESLVTFFVTAKFLKFAKSLRHSAIRTQDVTIQKAGSATGSAIVTMPREVLAEFIDEIEYEAEHHKDAAIRRVCRVNLPRLRSAR